MMRNYLKVLILPVLLLSSCNNGSEPVYTDTIATNFRAINEEYDPQRLTPKFYETYLGADISNIGFPSSNMWDDSAYIIYRIYADKEETKLVKASQLKKYDGSFHGLFAVGKYYDLGTTQKENCVDHLTEYDGEYTNCLGDKMIIENGKIRGTYSEYSFSTTEIRTLSPGHYDFEIVTITIDGHEYDANDLSKGEASGFNPCNIRVYQDEKHLWKAKQDLTKFGFCFSMLDICLSDYFEDWDKPLETFYYTRNNDFSIDYDL